MIPPLQYGGGVLRPAGKRLFRVAACAAAALSVLVLGVGAPTALADDCGLIVVVPVGCSSPTAQPTPEPTSPATAAPATSPASAPPHTTTKPSPAAPAPQAPVVDSAAPAYSRPTATVPTERTLAGSAPAPAGAEPVITPAATTATPTATSAPTARAQVDDPGPARGTVLILTGAWLLVLGGLLLASAVLAGFTF